MRARKMRYRVLSFSSGETVDSTEMHVLALAYRAAWRSTYAIEPAGQHLIASLDLVIDFGDRMATGTGSSATDVASRGSSTEGPADSARRNRHGD